MWQRPRGCSLSQNIHDETDHAGVEGIFHCQQHHNATVLYFKSFVLWKKFEIYNFHLRVIVKIEGPPAKLPSRQGFLKALS